MESRHQHKIGTGYRIRYKTKENQPVTFLTGDFREMSIRTGTLKYSGGVLIFQGDRERYVGKNVLKILQQPEIKRSLEELARKRVDPEIFNHTVRTLLDQIKI